MWIIMLFNGSLMRHGVLFPHCNNSNDDEYCVTRANLAVYSALGAYYHTSYDIS